MRMKQNEFNADKITRHKVRVKNENGVKGYDFNVAESKRYLKVK